MMGKPVAPLCHAERPAGSSRHGNAAKRSCSGRVDGVRKRRQQVVAELAPAQLAEERAGGPAQSRRLLFVPARRSHGGLQVDPGLLECSTDGVPDLPRRQLSPVQVRRETGTAVQVGAVAVGGIAGEPHAQKRLEAPVAVDLARLPQLGESTRPRAYRLVSQSAEREPVRSVRRRRQSGRRRHRLVGRAGRQAGAPERGEDRVGPAVLLAHGERVREQVHLAGHHGLDARRPQGRRERPVVVQFVRVEALPPDDGAGSRRASEGRDHVHRVAAIDQEPRPEPAQCVVQAPQRVPEPPARGAARRPGAALPWFPDVHRQERAAAAGGPPGRLQQGRVVAQAQVAPQPHHGDGREARRCPVAGRRLADGSPSVVLVVLTEYDHLSRQPTSTLPRPRSASGASSGPRRRPARTRRVAAGIHAVGQARV